MTSPILTVPAPPQLSTIIISIIILFVLFPPSSLSVYHSSCIVFHLSILAPRLYLFSPYPSLLSLHPSLVISLSLSLFLSLSLSLFLSLSLNLPLLCPNSPFPSSLSTCFSLSASFSFFSLCPSHSHVRTLPPSLFWLASQKTEHHFII